MEASAVRSSANSHCRDLSSSFRRTFLGQFELVGRRLEHGSRILVLVAEHAPSGKLLVAFCDHCARSGRAFRHRCTAIDTRSSTIFGTAQALDSKPLRIFASHSHLWTASTAIFERSFRDRAFLGLRTVFVVQTLCSRTVGPQSVAMEQPEARMADIEVRMALVSARISSP